MSDKIRYIGKVWWCGDDWCNCYQAQFIEQTPHKISGLVNNKYIWEGEFRSGDGIDDWIGCCNDLREFRDQLKIDDPELFALVEWYDID